MPAGKADGGGVGLLRGREGRSAPSVPLRAASWFVASPSKPKPSVARRYLSNRWSQGGIAGLQKGTFIQILLFLGILRILPPIVVEH